jgi:hypothetical protein
MKKDKEVHLIDRISMSVIAALILRFLVYPVAFNIYLGKELSRKVSHVSYWKWEEEHFILNYLVEYERLTVLEEERVTENVYNYWFERTNQLTPVASNVSQSFNHTTSGLVPPGEVSK